MKLEKNQEVMKKEILHFLLSQKIATLATVTKEGDPDAATVYYFIHENFDLYFFTEKNTQKFKNIEAHNNVTMLVTDVEKKRVVKIKGKAEVMKDESIVVEMVSNAAKMLNEGDGIETILPVLKA